MIVVKMQLHFYEHRSYIRRKLVEKGKISKGKPFSLRWIQQLRRLL